MMLRALLRLIGFLALAAGFVALVLDGVRWLATGQIAFAKVEAALTALAPSFVPLIEPAVTRDIHPLLWNYGLAPLLDAPAAAACGLLGVIFLWMGRKPAPTIGFSPR